MAVLVNKWAGRLFGTNTGNFFLELKQDEEENLIGTVRVMDNLYGLSVYTCSGSYKENLKLTCVPTKVSPDVVYGEVSVEAVLTPEGNLRGTWSSSLGTAGTLDAYPHDIVPANQSSSKLDGIPEQLYNKTVKIGSIRLFSGDVKSLISFIEQDFKIPQSIVTFNVRGTEATKYSKDFLKEVESLGKINYLKISIQEPEAHGINRIITVEFGENGQSEIRVSGINESWVVGKATSIALHLKPKENRLVTNFIKYGLNFNSVIVLATLIFLPEIQSLISRALFVVFIVVLLNVFLWIHRTFILNTVIYLTEKQPSIFSRGWPTIISWIAAASSSVFAAWVYQKLFDGF